MKSASDFVVDKVISALAAYPDSRRNRDYLFQSLETALSFSSDFVPSVDQMIALTVAYSNSVSENSFGYCAFISALKRMNKEGRQKVAEYFSSHLTGDVEPLGQLDQGRCIFVLNSYLTCDFGFPRAASISPKVATDVNAYMLDILGKTIDVNSSFSDKVGHPFCFAVTFLVKALNEKVISPKDVFNPLYEIAMQSADSPTAQGQVAFFLMRDLIKDVRLEQGPLSLKQIFKIGALALTNPNRTDARDAYVAFSKNNKLIQSDDVRETVRPKGEALKLVDAMWLLANPR